MQPELKAMLLKIKDMASSDLPASLRGVRAAWVNAGCPGLDEIAIRIPKGSDVTKTEVMAYFRVMKEGGSINALLATITPRGKNPNRESESIQKKEEKVLLILRRAGLIRFNGSIREWVVSSGQEEKETA